MVTVLDLIPSLTLQELIFQIFLPFIFIFAILWGVLTTLKIFEKKINLVISLVITLFLASTETFVLLTTYYSQISGAFVTFVFIGLFVVGTIIWAVRRGEHVYYGTSNPSHGIDRLNKKIGQLNKKYNQKRHSGNEEEADQIHRTLMELEKERDKLLRDYRSHFEAD